MTTTDEQKLEAMAKHPLRTLIHVREALRDLTRYNKLYTSESIDVVNLFMKMVRRENRRIDGDAWNFGGPSRSS